MNAYTPDFIARTRLELQLGAANRRTMIARCWCGALTAAMLIGGAAYVGWCS